MNINFVKQINKYRKAIFYLVLVLCIILLIAWGISLIYSLPISSMLDDPASMFEYNEFIGFTTFIGIIVLSIGIGSVVLMITIQPQVGDRKDYRFVVGLALITLFLTIDDLFMFHERIFTGLFHVGERRIFLTYMILFAIFLYAFRKQLMKQGVVFIVIACLFFILSMAADFLSDKVVLAAGIDEIVDLIEEGSKLGGYLFWTGFLIAKSRILIQPEGEASLNS